MDVPFISEKIFLYSVLRSQWLMIGFGGGLVILCAFLLTYLMIWRSRDTEETKNREPSSKVLAYMPWIFLLSTAGILIYMITYTVFAIYNPPNW